jgi:methionyl-tRNA formyltransferase
MRIIIYALGQKGLEVLAVLAKHSHVEIITCIIGKDAGVENDFSKDILLFCEKSGIPCTSKLDFVPKLGVYDFALAVGWRRLIQGVPPTKLLVFHDSLLPRYRGFAPLVSALLNREAEVGLTILLGAEKYDTGDIVLQLGMPIVYPTCISAETDRMAKLYGQAASLLVEKVATTNVVSCTSPQNEHDASYSLWRNDEDYRIDWTSSAEDIEHFIACVGKPYRGASTDFQGEIVRIYSAKAYPDVRVENRKVGKVIFINNDFPVVVCGRGLLALLDIKDSQGRAVLPLASIRTRFI